MGAVEGTRWHERLIARLERWHGARRDVTHHVGGGYRESTIHVPGHRPGYLLYIDRFGRWTDGIIAGVREGMIAVRWMFAIVLFGIGLAFVLHWAFRTRVADVTVVETRWAYTVGLRERRIMNASDWHDELHRYAFDVQCHREVRSHHECDPYPCPSICFDSRGRANVCITTCWHSCPDYDDYCRYHYPSWPTIATRTNGGVDHTPVRPNLTAVGGQPCVLDDEPLHAHGFDQCHHDELTYAVQFDAHATGHWNIVPTSRNEFDRYVTGESWRVRYNHAGAFVPVARVR